MKNSPEIRWAEYGNLNRFALFIVKSDMSIRHTSLIRNHSCELSSLLQVKKLWLVCFLNKQCRWAKEQHLSLPFISCKMLRGEDSISQKKKTVYFRTTKMYYCSMHIKYHSLSFRNEGLLGNSRSSQYSILDLRHRTWWNK